MKLINNVKSRVHSVLVSDIFSKDFEGLLEASQELCHVAQEFVLVLESLRHFTLEILHKPISLVLRIEFEFVEEFVC